MAFSVSCPECGTALEVEEDHREWTVRCPSCRHEFRPGNAAPAPTPKAEGGEAPSPPKRSRRSDRYDDDDDDDDDEYTASRDVRGPATALQCIGWFGSVLSLMGVGIWVLLLLMVMNNPRPQNQGGLQREEVFAQAMIYIPQGCVAFAISIVMIVGGRKMSRLESYGWAQAAAIVGMIPCISPCCLFGLPFGIWALTVLNRSDVQAAFRRNRRGAARFEDDD